MKLLAGSILFSAMVLFATSAHSVDLTFYTGGSTGAFEDPNSWTNGVPNANLIAEVETGGFFTSTGTMGTTNGINTVTLTESTSQSAAGLVVVSGVQIGTNTVIPGTVNFNITNDSTLTIGQNYDGGIDVTNQATLNFSGGIINVVGGDIIVGDVPFFEDLEGLGTINITSGILSDTNGSLYLGTGGGSTGNFTESGPSAVTVGNLFVGDGASTGTYNLQLGTLTVLGDDIIGDAGLGVLNQSGGTFNHASTTNLIIGESGTGIYNLSGGTANIGSEVILGDEFGSAGSIVQTSGVITIAGALVLGNEGTGTYTMTGGTANFNGGVIVGSDQGTGNFFQKGGTVVVPTGQTISILATNGTYNLNGGTLSIGDAGGTAAISGVGAFNFGGGSLVANGNSLTDSAPGTVTGANTITAPSATINLSGNLGGGGSFNFRGNNSTVFNLSGIDTYSGGTSLFNGTLNAGVANIPTNGPLFIGSGATVNLTGTTVGTTEFSGPLTGAGTFNLGQNSIQIDGSVNFTGTTNIGNGESLQVFNGTLGNLGASTGSFIVGGGTGTGTVNLIGTNLYTGTTTINPGFTLLARGLASAMVANAGTIGSNAAVGTPFDVGVGGTGNLAEVATSGTNIRLANTVADSFQVGSGNILGAVNVSGFSKLGTTEYTIVNSATPLNGGALQNDINTDALVARSNSPVLLQVTLVASPTDNQLLLDVNQLPISGFAVTPNQKAVANALDVALLSPEVNSTFFSTFNTLTAAGIPGALDQLTPESYLYMRDIAFENTTFLAQRVDGFLSNLRAGYAGLDSSGLSILGPGFSSPLGQSLGSMLAYNHEGPAPNGVNYYPDQGETTEPTDSFAPLMVEPSPAGPATISDSVDPRMAPTVGPAPSVSVLDDSGMGFNEFVGGNVILGELNQDNSGSDQPKANIVAGNVTAGVSFRMNSNLAAGVLFDYNHTDALTSAQGSHIRVDSYSPGLFATFFKKGFYANGLFTFGYNNYSDDRKITFGGQNTTASSSPDGEQYAPNIDAGYDFRPMRQLIVGPTGGIGYTHLDVDSFHETGAGEENLRVESQSADSLRARLGGHVVYLVQAGSILFQPNISASFQHEFLNDPYTLNSQLDLPGTPSFDTRGGNSGRNTGLISVGLTATFNYTMNFYLNYLAEVGGDDYLVQSVEGGLKASF